MNTKYGYIKQATRLMSDLRLSPDEVTARRSRGYASSVTRLRLTISILLMLTLGSGSVWGQVTYQYYAIHNKDNGYLKQVNGGIAVDKTFRYENSHDGNGSSIWVLSSDGYLQQEMYYLNVANDQTLYLSTEKVTQWTIDNTTASGKNYLKPSGSSKFLCADSGPQLNGSPSKYLNACEMTIAENSTKWDGPKDVSFTVQSPQLVTYLRTYYVHNIIATITKDDADKTNQKVVDKKDSRCYCSLTYSTTTDANKGTKWDINETSGVIYSKQASGDYSVAATYSVAPLDPIALSLHPAADKTVTLKLQPSPLAPDAEKNYLLFNTKEANYRFPYDDGNLNENDAVKTNASRSVLTEPATSPNNNISWKIVRDDEGFYSFRNVNSGRWLRFDGGQFVNGSDYGVIEVGADGDATPAGNEYKFRLYKSGTYKNTNTAPTYCILPYSKQYAVYKSDGVAANASVALSVYTTPKVISLNKANDDSKYCIFAYEAENRVYGNFTLSGPSSALATGDYVFNTTQSYSSRNIIGSPSNVQDLEIKDSYSVADLTFTWQVNGLDGYITKQTPTVSSGKGTQVVTVNSLPSGTLYGKVRVQAKGGSKYSGWKELEFNLYGEPSYTDITSLSQITSSDGYYRLTADVSDAPGVTEFSGFLDGNMHKISSVSAPLFTTLTGTVKNVILDNVSINSGDSDGNTGAIACKANGAARIYNVGILSGSVGGTSNTGGLVGFLDGSARVINCFSYANVSGGTVGGIVGYNNVATTATNLKTMVMNCMFYGEVSGSSIAPIYNGNIITNVGKNAGVSNFNYFRLESSYIQNTDITKVYNCALGAETRFLQRFEFFRNTLNSHRELAAWWATGSMDNKDKMMKWVLEPSQIGSSTPYPILKTPGYYPSVVNIDAENAPTTTERNKGGKLGTLSVTIQSGSGGAVFGAPTNASITNHNLTLNITDKDFDHFNFNYYKVQLPYYNDVGTGNYTGNRVVTGWKIVSITGGTPGTFSTSTADAPSFNFADRNCTNKDLYSVSGRVFNQGAYWDVPEGVTAIIIEPYWAKAAYVADAYPDVVYNTNMTEAYDVSNVGGGQKYTNNTNYNIAGEQQRVFTSISEAVTNANGLNKPTDNSVHDYAVVLVGNVHQYTGNNVAIGSNYKYTVTTIDLDHDNEPDYSLMLRNDGRNKLHPAKWDFLNIVGLGMAQKSSGGTGSYNQGIFQPLYWFETTNTSLFRVTQFEYDNTSRIEAPLILQGGVMEQWVSGQSGGRSNKTTYFHVGGNVWFKEFHRGTHQDQTYDSKHPPVSVTGGDYNEFYLTGLYTANVTSYGDNAECYINGGRFGVVAGAAMEGIGKTNGADNTGNITWQVQNADIKEFYAGGINAAKPVTGNLSTTITGGKIDLFCGGPKFGDMSTGKTVTTNATDCEFGTFFGAGYGGNSYSRQAPRNHNNMINFPHNDSQAGNDASWNAWLGRFYTQSYSSTYGGVSTQFSYQFLPMSGNADNCGRIFVEYVKFSLATCRNVTSTLTGCQITGNFYGGGSLGKVDGPVTSTLNGCVVQGSAFGAGFSASLPSVEVDATGFATEPYYYTDLGTYRNGVKGQTTTYTWQKKTDDSWVDNTNHILYTDEDLTSLGTVTGKATLTINGTTTVRESVYGGGEESGVGGDTEVTVNSGAIGIKGESSYGYRYGNVYGGGKGKIDNEGNLVVSSVSDLDAGLVKGNTSVTINGTTATTTIVHNVYGGGAVGSVGTFTRDANGMPTACTANTGNAVVTINGGLIGHNHEDTGMINGSSRGWEGNAQATVSFLNQLAWVNSAEVFIGDPLSSAEDKGPVILGSIYGGGENGHNFKDAVVRMYKGTVGNSDPSANTYNCGNVYGAGCGTDTYWIDANENGEKDEGEEHYNPLAGVVRGNATVIVKGGHVLRNVYGAGAMGSVGNEEEAEGSSTSGKTTVTITGNAKIGADDGNGNIYGAARGDLNVQKENFANVRTTEVEINGNADIKGSVFGGGEAGIVWEGVTVNMLGGTVAKDLYGGGALADTQLANNNEGNTPSTYVTTVNLKGGTINHNAYGGGLGTSDTMDDTGTITPDGVQAMVYGDVILNLNEGVANTSKGCIVKGSIFGCNNLNGTPKGNVTVHIHKTQNAAAETIANPAEGEKTAKVMGRYDVTAVYGGGNLSAYEPKSDDATVRTASVIIDGCELTSICQVYGGGNAASTPATNVTVNGTYEIMELFGGGNGQDDIIINSVTLPNPGANVGYKNYSEFYKDGGVWKVRDKEDADTKEKRTGSSYVYGSGAASVDIHGGTIHRVFGGSNTKGNVRQTAVTMLEDASGCPFKVDEAYGGGKSASMDAEAKLLMACIPGLNAVYGGAEDANIHGDVSLTITNGTFDRVFGGNNKSGQINGSITVNIEEVGCRPIIIGELYGGGNLAPYSIYGYNTDGTPKESGANPSDDPEVNVKSFTSIGTVYGGGYGEQAVMVGSPTVNINEVADPESEAQNKSYTEDAQTKYYSNFAGDIITIDGHEVIRPSHVKGKMGAINSVFGGGNAAPVKGNTTVNIGTALGDDIYIVVPVAAGTDLTGKGYYTKSGNDYVTATGEAVADTTYYKKYTVLGVDIRDNIYGGGNNAEVTGKTNVNIGKKVM